MNTECTLCSRECKANRQAGERGYCGANASLIVSRAELHHWEEPCISGDNGSGTVFFAGCQLQCVFCQNKEISRDNFGREISIDRLSEIFLELQAKKAHNINLVTPTHYILEIKKALDIARARGLSLPVVYNTSGYEKPSSIKILEGYVDVYLPDFKYYDNTLGEKYSSVSDYCEKALSAIDTMLEQAGEVCFNDDGIITRGVIIRHLVLPNHIENSKKAIEALYKRYGDRVYLSIMSQYTPFGDLTKYPKLKRKLTQKEYDEVVDYAIMLGVENGFIQEGEAANESFIPPFDLSGV